METEYHVLTHLHENEATTQRKISKHTGLSLGAVNLLIKKMIKKGLIKIERLNPRTVRYILTPKGIQEKSRLTYRYIRQSYRQITRINQALDHLLEEHLAGHDGSAVILYGPKDEIYEILSQQLKNKHVSFELHSSTDSLENLSLENGRLVLVWREEEENSSLKAFQVINLLKLF